MQTIGSFFCAIWLFIMTIGSYLSPLPALLNKRAAANGGQAAVLPLEGGSDPWYVEGDGEYHYCYSIGEGVAIRHAKHPFDLGTGEETIAYRAPRDTMYSWAYWAPELHKIGESWYLYVAASDTESENHRMYVLKGDDPRGTFEMIGKIGDPSDKWAIDGTVLAWEDELYFIWSGWEGDADGQQNLYIAHMSDPCTIDGERFLLSAPTYSWEKQGMPINEGPTVLKKDGHLSVVYAASGSWTDDYCIGLLRFRGGDVTDGKNWSKDPIPLLPKVKGAYGPGHCSFLQGKDGTDYVVYHANVESGTGWNGRTVRVQPFGWRLGFPVFGLPMKPGETVYLS